MLYDFHAGSTPVLVNVPHAGTELPPAIAARLTSAARTLPDTDWHVHRLVAMVPELGASLLCARQSRYVIDLNRGPDDKPLYAGATTGLVPTETFAGDRLYQAAPPDRDEIFARVERYWRPYHDRLAQTLAEIRRRHGHAILFDVHSIRSEIPRLFEGRLPDLNLGTFDGRSCASSLQQLAAELLAKEADFSSVVNGRFKGGYSTRHYGQPEENIHALQLEIAQNTYMDEQTTPQLWDADRARPVMRVIERLVEALAGWRGQ